MTTSTVYYRAEDGSEPVKEFLDQTFPSSPRNAKASHAQVEKFARRRAEADLQIDRLNGLPDNFPPLAVPMTSQIEDELRELRIQSGGQRYRILYQRSGNLFILLHATHKTSRAVPENDIKLAQKRFEDFKHRMNANPRWRPRAAGSDAP